VTTTFHTLSRRKQRLYAVACCRRIWHLLPDERCRDAVVVAEQFADGLATTKAIQQARSSAQRTATTVTEQVAKDAAWAVVWATSPAARMRYLAQTVGEAAARAAAGVAGKRARAAALENERDSQQLLLHDLRPPATLAFDPSWRTPTVVGLVEAIYEDRAFDSLPMVADALENAECHDATVLGHCRHPGPHVRGCWLIDLLTAKE
jgi:hypothetical protein